jgi:hypothetical protein
MSEFCAGVKILLERMKSNPEDFEMVEFNAATDQGVQGRFYQFAQSMDDVILGKQNKDRPWRDWQYFTEEERQALIGGFKEMKRANFDKHIMERVFDEHYIERQQERIRFATQSINTANLQNMAAKGAQQTPPGTFITTTTNTGGGLMSAIGLGGVFK